MPKVSIVITTKNEEQHIENCLRSIVAQTGVGSMEFGWLMKAMNFLTRNRA